MVGLAVTFTVRPGIAPSGFENVRLTGSWGGEGSGSTRWSAAGMKRTTDIDGIHVSATHDANRVLAFHRWEEAEAFFVAGSLGDAPYASGYWLSDDRLGDGEWVEVFNSDAAAYGGWNVGNGGRTLRAEGGALNLMLPASGVVVLRRC